MANINKVEVSGNLTNDPQLSKTSGGMSVLTFSIAVNDSRKNNQTGQWEDVPNFFNCVVFGAQADGLAKFMTKGLKVFIDGKLHWSSWEKDGKKNSKVDIIVNSIDFAQQKKVQAQEPTQQQQPVMTTAQIAAQQAAQVAQAANNAQQQIAAQQTVDNYINDEDIPF